MSAKRTPGERIAELCKTYSISRENLAERSGVPLELIRRIEEEAYIPDLAPLLKLSRALGVRLGTLLDDREELGPVYTPAGKAGEASRFKTGTGEGAVQAAGKPAASIDEHKGLTFKALAADKSSRHMEPFIVDIEPDAEQSKSSHEGEEFIHVLAGKVHIDYGKDSYDMSEGDSIYYDSIVPHRVLSGNGQQARILAVIYTPA